MNVFPKLISLRFVIYPLLTIAVREIMLNDAQGMQLEKEFSVYFWTEILQGLVLVASSAIYLTISISRMPNKHIGLVFFAICAISLLREQYLYFVDNLGQTTWIYPILLILLPTAYQLGWNFRQFYRELKGYIRTLSFGIYFSGLLTVYIFSKMFGRKAFWYGVMEEQYFGIVKNTAQDCMELYGYILMMFAAIEMLIHSFNNRIGSGNYIR